MNGKTLTLTCLQGILLSLLMGTHARAATTYYVAPNGLDTNPGTLSQPFGTLSKAASMAKAGDGILLRGGTYQLKQSSWIGAQGTATARISISPYPNEKPIFDGSALASDQNCIGIGGTYITLIGIECRSIPRTGIVVWCGQEIRILNNIVHDTGKTGIMGMCNQPNVVRNIQVDGNTVYRTNLSNQARTTSGGWGTGMSVIGSSDVTFSNNRVYENYGEGIGCFASVRCVVRGNRIYDNYSVNLYIANSTDTTAERNLVYSTGNTSFFRNVGGVWGPAVGIQLGDEGCNDPVRVVLNNVVVRNNVVINGRSGFYYGNYICPDAGMKNTRVVNNTFYGSSGVLLNLDASPGSSGNTIANNIFYQTNGKPMTAIADKTSITYQNNLWYGGSAGVAARQSDITTNPQFILPGSLQAENYRLKSGSPAIDKGSTTSVVTNDYLGTNRPQFNGIDIGGFEFY